jgi:hypothetical protein
MARPGRQRDRHDLAALARDRQRPVTSRQAELMNIGGHRLRHPQPVQREERRQRVILG